MLEDRSGYQGENAATSGNDWQDLLGRLYRLGCLVTVLFNTAFATLTIVTLCGIVFITRPKQAMHDLPPWAWLPLLIIMAPAQVYSQLLAWRTIAAGKTATGPAIVAGQVCFPALLRPLVAFAWLANFVIGFGIVVSLSKPDPGGALVVGDVLLIAVLAFWLTFAANVYLLLAVHTVTNDEEVLWHIWRRRLVVDMAIAVFAAVYYFL